VIGEGETCDDANLRDGDGCSSRCQLEEGYACPSGWGCVQVGVCGDGMVAVFGGEVCDDANAVPGDGCSANCKAIEPGYVCKAPNQPCLAIADIRPHCGDGVVQSDEGETCDDGVNDGSLGSCSADCLVPACGDGARQPDYGETCDDGVNSSGYITCGPDCTLADPPPSLVCDPPPPSCGNGVVEREYGEECDDRINDGLEGRCGPNCVGDDDGFCGDGKVNPLYEECDDGNWESCDGCSAKCQNEAKVL
jgi:cysteine-rich repeat protein